MSRPGRYNRRTENEARYGKGAYVYRSVTAYLQNGTCDICGDSTSPGHLDHNHAREGAAAWRGLLCPHCNKGLSGFKDDPIRLAKAIDYLKKWA